MTHARLTLNRDGDLLVQVRNTKDVQLPAFIMGSEVCCSSLMLAVLAVGDYK